MIQLIGVISLIFIYAFIAGMFFQWSVWDLVEQEADLLPHWSIGLRQLRAFLYVLFWCLIWPFTGLMFCTVFCLLCIVVFTYEMITGGSTGFFGRHK